MTKKSGKKFDCIKLFSRSQDRPSKIFFFNKELDSENRIQSVKDLNKLFDDYVAEYGQPEYIFIDEIQDIQDWERFVRARFALKRKIIISWSNSQLLSWELATYLTGRYLSFEVYPLNFSEYLLFTKIMIYDKRWCIICVEEECLKSLW